MPGRDVTYPFSAVIGETAAKRALMCLLADGTLGGVLIKGPPGTAKSILMRSLSRLTDRRIVDLPAGSGDEDIFGGIDLERAVAEGESRLRKGILGDADGNILCIDNINLIDPRTLGAVMEAVSSGTLRIEREGISAECPCRTAVVATMDPLERGLPDSVEDRFDICIVIAPSADIGMRGDIVESDLAYREDPEGFSSGFSSEDAGVRSRIENARRSIPSMRITRRDIQDIVRICGRVNSVGHRGDIACARVARDLAAIDGRDVIGAGDIREASVMCLVHRRAPLPPSEKGAPSADAEGDCDLSDGKISSKEIAELSRMDLGEQDGGAETEMSLGEQDGGHEEKGPDREGDDAPIGEDSGPQNADVDVITMVLREVKNDLAEIDRAVSIRLSSVVGQVPRGTDGGDRNGRTRGFRIPEGRTSDPALGATIRAAAPCQRMRAPNGLKVVIRQEDIRENVRKKRSTCSFLFGLDVSGSLVNTGGLEDAVMCVRAMLEDGYVRRDRVGLLTFGQYKVNLAVPFTRNVETVIDSIRRTQTGGSTPLGQALLTIQKYMGGYVRKNPGERCFVILITDGEPDRPVVEGYEPWAELRRIASTVRIPNTEWVLIDNGKRGRRVNRARILAGILDMRYIEIDELIGKFDVTG